MSSDEPKPLGRDFSNGVLLSEITDGGMLPGNVGGEAVLLSRRGEEVFAISATCTHYGGPLAEGVIDGDVIRCPWHHACFSLRTGEALRAPALTPVACWHVERRGEHVIVKQKVERDALAPTFPLSTDRPNDVRRVVIVGAGAAGSAAAEMLRRCGFTGSVTVVDEEPDSPYDRPNLSKDFLAGSASEEWIPLRPEGFYAAHQIEIVRATASRIDIGGKMLELPSGAHLPFDALLLATGASPVQLPLPGIELPLVHYLRSLADSRAIIAAAARANRVVVIGSSFIGLEVAASLRARGLEVHIVAAEAVPLERVLGAGLGEFIKSLHESHGVVFHLERKPARVESTAVVLDDGTRIETDLVVVGVGVRPRLTLAEQAGLAIDRGVTVNAYLETSAAGIYAAGDIARWPDPHSGERIRVEHWVVAQRMGQTAARNILGAQERFDQVPFFWSAHYDVGINYVGHAEKWDALVTDGSAEQRNVAVRFERAGKLLALATISRDRENLSTEIAMEHGAP
jgi:NADPH-dependent 2,4-dienoyl-CoA reductase/sulfur reductase-like enzyme/nitrite reductase/ring-hydroxylating ferredoxin subunit